uniref:Uncharacterized protein n=1 Tax=Anguilla anguilla TaxID=7936 RepID=A0A0E9WAH0_ANGAN
MCLNVCIFVHFNGHFICHEIVTLIFQ